MTGNNRKWKITVPAAVLLLALYMVIFGFSAQDGEQSGSLSQMISEKCVELFNSLSGGKWSKAFMEGLAAYFEHPIRKLAHFSEYACMGILVYVLWAQWMDRGRRLYLLTVGWVFLSAAADEFHQLFVPGRYGSFADVLLDTCGGSFGMALCMLAAYLHRRSVRKRKAAGKTEGPAGADEEKTVQADPDTAVATNGEVKPGDADRVRQETVPGTAVATNGEAVPGDTEPAGTVREG